MAMGIPYAWTPEIEQFIRGNVKGVMYKDLAAMLKKEFDFEVLPKALARKCQKMNCPNGLNCKFPKGHVPSNKGHKGYYSPGSEKGWFKKGHMPSNHKPVGSERVTKDGYIEIKVAEPNKWRLKHHVIWENAHGAVPEQHSIMFRDGNSKNCVLDNLALVRKREILVMNRFGLASPDTELMSVGLHTAKLLISIQDKKR